MINQNWQKSITLKSGVEVVLRYPSLDDTEQFTEYINVFVDEDEFLLIDKKQTVEQELGYVKSVVKDIQQGNLIQIVVECQNTVVAMAHLIKGKYKASHVGSLGISVKREFRKQGLGTALLLETIEQGKELFQLKIIELSLFANNEKARKLYEKYGFQEYGRLPKGLKYKQVQYVDQVFMYKLL